MRGNGLSAPAPLLDVPDRLGPLPRDKVFWCVGGFASAPVVLSLARPFGAAEALTANLALFFALWLVAIVCATMMAFVRPGGLNALQWGQALMEHSLRPHNTTWWR